VSEQPDPQGPGEIPPEQVPTIPTYPSGGSGDLPYAPPAYPAAGPGGFAPAGADGPAERSGMGLAALIVAIVAVPAFFFNGIGILLALIALVLGIIAWARAGKRNRRTGMAIAAVIVSAVVLVVGIVLVVVETNHITKACAGVPKGTNAYTQCAKNNSKL
jgi:hypothetical protein